MSKKMKNNKDMSEFQKRVFSKIDETMDEYISKDDEKSATAFAMKIKERVEIIFGAMQMQGVHNKDKKEREELLKYYQSQIEDYIPKLKDEVAQMIERSRQTPSYIGFMINELKGGLDIK